MSSRTRSKLHIDAERKIPSKNILIEIENKRTFAVWEVQREDEFSPLKNATGNKDTAETSRRDLMEQHVRFLRQAGVNLP